MADLTNLYKMLQYGRKYLFIHPNPIFLRGISMENYGGTTLCKQEDLPKAYHIEYPF